MVKNLPANAENVMRCAFDPWVRKIPGRGHGSSLQYSCLENFTDRGAWRVIVHRVTKSWTRLKGLSTQVVERTLSIKTTYKMEDSYKSYI